KVDLWTSLPLRRFSAPQRRVRDRFWMKRYGPSRRRAQNASAALKIFIRHPKKTFATISALFGHKRSNSRCSLIDVKQTSQLRAPKSEDDPEEILDLGATWEWQELSTQFCRLSSISSICRIG